MLKALEDMHIRPTEAVNLIRDLLRVKSFIVPMSEQPVHLAAVLDCGSSVVGEVSVDSLVDLPKSVFLVPYVAATPEAIQALQEAEVILFGPGSFLTSIIPPLLLPEIIEQLQHSRAKKIFIDNLGTECGPAARLSLTDRIQWIHETVGKPIIDGAIVPTDTTIDEQLHLKILAGRLNADDVSYRHDRTLLCSALRLMN